MARFIKNDINFHGARSKTSVVENRSSAKQNSKNNDDGWGSIPNSSKSASNWDDGWGDGPNVTSVPDDAWGEDRLVSGKAERNRKFRSDKENSSFRVPIQSLPNWDEVDKEFPSLGSKAPPRANVWEKRQQDFEEKKAIVPSSLSEEEKMIQQAIELSKMESRQEEERRRELEEEYRLQTQLLEANPNMFDEFRLSREDVLATSGGFASQSHGNFNDQSEKFPSEEIVNPGDYGRGWDYTSEKTTKELKKGKKKTESSKQEDSFPLLKQNSALPPAFHNVGTQPKISKVVKMFGGWGNTKPSNQDIVETKSASKSNKWDTVDTNFVSRPAKKSAIEDKSPSESSTPSILEVKLENTSNWDAVDTIDLKSASETKGKNWEEDTSVQRNYLGTRDAVELNLKDCEPGYSLDQKEQEFVTQSKRKNSKPKVDLETEVKGKTALSGKETGEFFEQGRDLDLNNVYDGLESRIDEHRNETSNSEQSQGISATRDVGAKAEVSLGEDKCSDSHGSIENDYAFLLSRMGDTHTQLKDKNQNHIIQIEGKSDISNRNSQPEISQAPNPTTSSFSFDYFVPDLTTGEDPSIPGPKPIKPEAHSPSNPQLDVPNSGPCNTNDINPLYGFESDSSLPLKMANANLKDAPSLPVFGGFPRNAGSPDIPVDNDRASHIEPPKAPVPTPEFMNPAFLPQPRPMLTPLMNPALMMGMNPMLMQQMMMLSNPFFLQQLQQMDMYYKTLGMPLATGMPLFPQPIPIPAFHNPNLQAFSNSMDVGPGSTSENGTIAPPTQTPGNPLSGSEAFDEVSPEVNQPDTDSFWFQDYMSADASPSFIPPPKPTSVNAQADVPPGISAPAFASLPLNAQNTGYDRLSDQSSYDGSNRSEVPYATGWGDIDGESKSHTASGWNDGDNATIAKSMRNSSRYVSEKEGACRQPASRPSLRRPKT